MTLAGYILRLVARRANCQARLVPNGWTGTGSAPTSGIYLQKIGTDLLHVGDGAIAPVGVTTYIYEVKKA